MRLAGLEREAHCKVSHTRLRTETRLTFFLVEAEGREVLCSAQMVLEALVVAVVHAPEELEGLAEHP